MVFVRVKSARGRPYAYLVESRWDRRTGRPRQRVVRYLGRLDRLDPRSLPRRYRTFAVTRALERLASAGQARRRDRAEAVRRTLVDRLVAGEAGPARALARSAVRELGRDVFLAEVLTEAMHEIGRDWSTGRISVSQEHLASGLAHQVVSEMNGVLGTKPSAGPEVVLCAPDGEGHTLPLAVAEVLLRARGYRPISLGASAPTPSIAAFVDARRPAAVWVSVTRADCLDSAAALLRRLHREVPDSRLALGGQAVGALPAGAEPDGVEVVRLPLLEYLEAWPRFPREPGSGAARRRRPSAH